MSNLPISGNLHGDGRVLHVVSFQREELPFAAICTRRLAKSTMTSLQYQRIPV